MQKAGQVTPGPQAPDPQETLQPQLLEQLTPPAQELEAQLTSHMPVPQLTTPVQELEAQLIVQSLPSEQLTLPTQIFE